MISEEFTFNLEYRQEDATERSALEKGHTDAGARRGPAVGWSCVWTAVLSLLPTPSPESVSPEDRSLVPRSTASALSG